MTVFHGSLNSYDPSVKTSAVFMRRPKGAIVGEYRKLWWTLIGVLTVTFAILGFSGVEIYRQVPPVPDRVVSASGDVLMTRSALLHGQTAWQSTGGLHLGSTWGHGAPQPTDRR